MTNRILDATRRTLAHRYSPIGLALFAILISSPALQSGWRSDDLIHRATLLESGALKAIGLIHPEGRQLSRAVMDIFNWVTADRVGRYMDFGLLPWWTFRDLVVSFWRPLSAFTHWLDYTLWPGSPLLMHTQNILWFGGMVAMITLLYRQFMQPTWIAGLGALLYSLSIDHYYCVSWLASRNVLLAAFFGTLAIITHHHWRQERVRSSAFLSVIGLTLALLSAEAGVATLAYLVSYAVFIDRGSGRQRALSQVPSLAVILAWRLIYEAMGYQAAGSGLYLDPGGDFRRFVFGVMERGPDLLLAQLGWLPLYKYTYLSYEAKWLLWFAAVLFVAAIFMLLFPLLRRDRVARFWALGMVLSAVPACAANFLSSRQTIFIGLGGMGLVAQVVGGVLDQSSWLARRQIRRIGLHGLCVVFISLHFLYPLYHRLKLVKATCASVKQADPSADIVSFPVDRGQDLIIVNCPDAFSLFYFPFRRVHDKRPLPAHVRALTCSLFPIEVTRIEENTLVVRSIGGYLIPTNLFAKQDLVGAPKVHRAYRDQFFSSAFRDGHLSMRRGEKIDLTGLSIEVTKLGNGGLPSEAVFRFAHRLEDSSFKWLRWDRDTNSYTPFLPPEMGQAVRINGRFSRVELPA